MNLQDELGRLLERVHPRVGSIEYSGASVPCIGLEQEVFEAAVSGAAGKPASVETGLNILQDDEGHVFVELVLALSGGVRTVLINANTSLEFFEQLAETSMLAITPPDGEHGGNVFMIQLPKPERARDALELIRRGLASRAGDNAVAGI